jgi:diacylglycerol kinase (ATP)
MIGIIYNPIAAQGKYKGRMRDFLVLLDSLQIKYDYRETEKPKEAFDLAKELAKTCTTIVPAGGDGTVFEVITALWGTDVRYCILPYGSGNDAFRSIYGDECTDEELLQHMMSESEISVDCARINDTYTCVSLTSYGFAADLTKVFKEKGGSYLSQTVKFLFKVNRRDYTVKIDDTEREVSTEFIFMTNTGCAGGGIRVNKECRFDDGFFELMILHKSSMLRRFINFAAIPKGTLYKQPNMETIRCKECTIIPHDNKCVNMDGELYDLDHAHIKMVEGGLRFAFNH